MIENMGRSKSIAMALIKGMSHGESAAEFLSPFAPIKQIESKKFK